MKPISLWPFLVFLLFHTSCKHQVESNPKNKKEDSVALKAPSTIKAAASSYLTKEGRSKGNNYLYYFGDKVLNHKSNLIKFYLEKYTTDCKLLEHADSVLDEFKSVKNIGDINGDGFSDTVFVMPPLSYCEDGYSYYFFDKKIPRLLTDSYCCDPESFFSIGDVDDDGLPEIATYYSSCSGRYKAIIVYGLKNKEWQKIGESVFDVLTQDPTKVSLPSLVKKISKGKFKMLNFDNDKKYWTVIKMK